MTRLPVVLLCLLVTSSASAYVRSRSNGCTPVFWTQSCLYVQPDASLTTDMPAADVERNIQSAMSSWNDRLGDSFIKLNYLAPSGAKETQYDRAPVIKFRTGKWCRPGACGTGKETCYDASAAAITTVYFVDKPGDARDGTILDADIEMNNVNNFFFEAKDGVPTPPRMDGRSPADLWNTLTHELGHLLGLEHTCRAVLNDGLPECTKDQNGERAPLCSYVQQNAGTDPNLAAVAQTTMFATASPGEVKKRLPKADDIAGVVAAYPKASDPKVCQMPDTQDPCNPDKGCSAATQGARGGGVAQVASPLLALCLLAGLRLFHRRREAVRVRRR